MAIRRLLKNSDLNLQEQQLLELVYRRTLQQLNLVCGDPWCEASRARSSTFTSAARPMPSEFQSWP